MLLTTQSPMIFQSGGKAIRLDAYLPQATDGPVPAVIALHGAGGGVAGMERYAALLAAQGFAVYLLRYFDRTGTEVADKSIMWYGSDKNGIADYSTPNIHRCHNSYPPL